jgi:hypothetical protein
MCGWNDLYGAHRKPNYLDARGVRVRLTLFGCKKLYETRRKKARGTLAAVTRDSCCFFTSLSSRNFFPPFVAFLYTFLLAPLNGVLTIAFQKIQLSMRWLYYRLFTALRVHFLAAGAYKSS